MNRIFTMFLLLLAVSLPAATEPRGADRLCELAVFPKFDLGFKFGVDVKGGVVSFAYGQDPTARIAELRRELKQKPDDVSRLLQLGSLYSDINETNATRVCLQDAEQLCRRRLEANPKAGLVWSDLGRALDGLGKLDEAESCCRKATQVSPKEWQCWVALGEFLSSRAWSQLFQGKSLMAAMMMADAPAQGFAKYRLSREALDQIVTLNTEAADCYDRAVALAPGEADVFLQRASYKMISSLGNLFIQFFRGNTDLDLKRNTEAFLFTKPGIPDLKQAVRLNPRNYEALGLTTVFEWMTACAELKPESHSLDALPDETRRSILDAGTLLENLSQDADKKTAAGAAQFCAIVKIMCSGVTASGFQTAEPYLRRAVALDPSSEASWDLLMGALISSPASSDELVAVCEARLKAKNSARNHLLLAKALTYQKSWTKAVQETAAATRLETNNPVAPIMLAALAIRQGAKPENLAQAALHLRHARELLQTLPADEDRDQRLSELMLNAALFRALSGQPDGARELVESVLKRFPDNESAQKIKEALPDS